MGTRIEPRVLKGFRDYLPDVSIERNRMIRLLERVFMSFGFVPIETPAIEYTEILLGKGSDETDKQLYRFLDNGERDVALRFDLTVPLARFAAAHIDQLGTPFKRFHIAPVWRAEKPQRGRYREFFQCDFDTIGTRSVFADAEIVAVIHSALQALDIRHQIRVNNRRLLNGFFETLQVSSPGPILRAIDKLEKQGREAVERELMDEAGLNLNQISTVFTFVEMSATSDSSALLTSLRSFGQEHPNDNFAAGLDQLQSVYNASVSFGVPKGDVGIDLSIARGLDYYTGTVFETRCLDLPEIGSICSGGRYDNLASLYTSRDLPGVGASIGLDRIIAALEELGRLSKKQTLTQILVTVMDEKYQFRSIELAAHLRQSGFNVEVYPESSKIANQMKYADRKGIDFVLFVGEREVESERYAIKNLKTGEQLDAVPRDELVQRFTALVSS